MNVNYRKEMDKLLSSVKAEKEKPTLLLHSCCGPCSTYCVRLLKDYFDLTVFYYNPNIYPNEEYLKRLGEQRRFLAAENVPLIEGAYDIREFYNAVSGHENDMEGGERCKICCALRLEETAKQAKDRGFEWFTSTLSVSPLKNAAALNEAGAALEKKYGVKYLISDFKKKDGYLTSIRLSKEFGLYRQNYCGCEFSYRKTVL